MKRLYLVPLLAGLVLAGCTTYQPERDTTQPGKIRKAALGIDGAGRSKDVWYMATTVIDVPWEAGFTFPGEASELWKIRWVLEEDYLYAYKVHEMVVHSELAEGQDDFIGEPVAAYRVEHLDVWYQYNPVTGERMPVKYEARERPWWEREWVRVDWSKNYLQAFDFMFKDLCKWSGDIIQDPVSYYPTRDDDPEQFYVATRMDDGSWQEHYGWDAIENLTGEDGSDIDYIDVVNREFVHYSTYKAFTGVDISCWPYPVWPIDGGIQVTERLSFMKVPPQTYTPRYYPDKTWEKFKFWRAERDVYDPERGLTDFKVYNIGRWNIWKKTRNEDGTEIPFNQREIKPIVYYYIPPERQVSKAACEKAGIACVDYIREENYQEVARQWNEAFRGVLKAVGHPQAKTAEVFIAKPIEYTCGPNGDRACQQLGDLRYSFMYNHDTRHSAEPLGYGPSFMDPETGEIIAATANFYGAALRSYSGLIGDYYDLVKGNFTELEIMTGENVRAYFENLSGNILPPRTPVVSLDALTKTVQDGRRGDLDFTNPAKLDFRQLELRSKLEELKQSYVPDMMRRQKIVGTDAERMLIPQEYLRVVGLPPDTPLTDDVMDIISPVRPNSIWQQAKRHDHFFAERNMLRGDIMWQDLDVESAIRRAEEALGANATKREVVDWLLRRLFIGIEAHEVGHTVGLYHNFEGSFDEENYHPEYFEILDQYPDVKLGTIDPDTNKIVSDWDTDGDGVISAEEYQAYDNAWLERRREQEAAGMDLWNTAAIMDYNGTSIISAEIAGVGRYERAALKFGYGNRLEVYSDNESDFDPDEVAAAGGWEKFKLKKLNRVDIEYYPGGQRCNATSECPYSDHPVAPQRCRANLGRGRTLTDGSPEDLGVCTDIYTELHILEQGGVLEYPEYRTCSDSRRGDKPFCSVWDEGRSAQEIVQKTIEQYERNYIFTNFRRYRASFGPFFYYRGLFSRFHRLGKIYQALLYSYYYRPDFVENIGPGGMLDSFLASRMSMNFFAKVLATPSIGSYIKWDPNDTQYDGPYSELEQGWADIYVGPGIGKYLYTAYEDGELGALWRPQRMGIFYDKRAALEALTTRDWGQPAANDETFPLNYYDGFQDEMLSLFRGLISEDFRSYAPVIRAVDDQGVVTQIEYRDLWRGDFLGTPTEEFRGLEAVRGYDTPPTYNGEVLDAGGSIYIRLYSLLYALLDFPVFFDANFPAYAQLYAYGKPSARESEVIQNDPTVTSYMSEDRGMLYVVPETQGNRSLFKPILEKANQYKQRVEQLRSYNGTPPVGFSDLPENQICYKILGLRSSDPQAQRDMECYTWLLKREEGRMETEESVLRQALDFLSALGYPTQ